MPGYLLHLHEGCMLVDSIHEYQQLIDAMHTVGLPDYYISNGILSDEWKNDFLLGCLLPDATSDKNRSHFRCKDDVNRIVVLPHEENFLKRYGYQEILRDPIKLGYFMHLHLDRHFWSSYLLSEIVFMDSDYKPCMLKDHVRWVGLDTGKKIISVSSFYSDKGIYRDYSVLNHIILDQYAIRIPGFVHRTDDVVAESSYANLECVIEELYDYMKLYANLNRSIDDLLVINWNKLDSLICVWLKESIADIIKFGVLM